MQRDENDLLPHFALENVREGERATIVISGELDVFTAPQLQAALNDAFAHDVREIVLDARGLSFVDARGVDVLVLADQHASTHSARLTVYPSHQLRRVLRIVGLESVILLVNGRSQ